MQHFPIFLNVHSARIVLSGGGEAALAKLRLLLKTEAQIDVFATAPAQEIARWAEDGHLRLFRRAVMRGDISGATLFYAADEDTAEDARTAAIARYEGALVNIVDNLQDSSFITPAIVDRDPLTIAIGTEGAAPVLARAIKADLEARLSPSLGVLARIGKAFRPVAERLPSGLGRRSFWSDFYFGVGPRAFEADGVEGVKAALDELLASHLVHEPQPGRVDFVGAGPGDPELLTLKARSALDQADVIIHDRLVSREVLELARREAAFVNVGKEGFGPSTSQEAINALIVEHAGKGAHVVRLKSGDPTVFGRLDEEIEAVAAAGIDWRIVPGITAASAAVATIGQSLTQRGRNSSVRILTGYDVQGFAEHEWTGLARPGAVTAIYMGKKSARFVQGRLMMYGAATEVPVTIVENASQPNQRVHATDLGGLALSMADVSGPALTFIGLSPRRAMFAVEKLNPKEMAL